MHSFLTRPYVRCVGIVSIGDKIPLDSKNETADEAEVGARRGQIQRSRLALRNPSHTSNSSVKTKSQMGAKMECPSYAAKSKRCFGSSFTEAV
jgi:hypothetical protein